MYKVWDQAFNTLAKAQNYKQLSAISCKANYLVCWIISLLPVFIVKMTKGHTPKSELLPAYSYRALANKTGSATGMKNTHPAMNSCWIKYKKCSSKYKIYGMRKLRKTFVFVACYKDISVEVYSLPRCTVKLSSFLCGCKRSSGTSALSGFDSCRTRWL